MNDAGPDFPYDQAAAAVRALLGLGQVPGPDPVLQLEHVVTLLFAHSTELLASVIETRAGRGRSDEAALEHLERVYEQCLTGLAPLTAAAMAANPVEPRPAAPAQEAGRPGGWGCDWQGQTATAPEPLWRIR